MAYGSYYLRYLLDHYDGNEMLAVAAYNGGLANVDRWVAQANAAGRQLTVEAIPFPRRANTCSACWTPSASTAPPIRVSSGSAERSPPDATGVTFHYCE